MGTVVDLAEKDPAIKAPVKGYALASFARAHAVTADTLSDMTSRYLRYKLEGLDVNEILMQLWDTGSCSFVPYMLLQAVYGDKFRGLPVRDQTKIMLESRLTAFSAETGARLIRKAYLHDRDVVQTVLSSVADESTARQILQGVITREAPSKQLGIMCLRTPMHLPCANNRSKKCFVCPYRVPQVSSIFLIMSDIEEMIAKMNEALTEGSRKKYFLGLRDYYYPAAYEKGYSKKKFKMRCPKQHVFEQSPFLFYRYADQGRDPCPYCDKRARVIPGINDAVSIDPEIELFYSKDNKKPPHEVSAYNGKTDFKFVCPYCGFKFTKRMKNIIGKHISVDGTFYSVPYTAYMEDVFVTVRSYADRIEIYQKDVMIAKHRRTANRFCTEISHMPPPDIRETLSWNGKRIHEWAASIGPETTRVIDGIIDRHPIEQQCYNTCITILQLSNKYGAARLEEACGSIKDTAMSYAYRSIKKYLGVLQ